MILAMYFGFMPFLVEIIRKLFTTDRTGEYWCLFHDFLHFFSTIFFVTLDIFGASCTKKGGNEGYLSKLSKLSKAIKTIKIWLQTHQNTHFISIKIYQQLSAGPIRTYQDLSAAIGSHQEPSAAIRSYQDLSGAIRTYQDLSAAIGSHQEPSAAIRSHWQPSGAIKTYQELSGPIRTYRQP